MNNKVLSQSACITMFVSLLTAGCTSLPEIEEAATVSLHTWYAAPFAPEVDVDGNPDLHPGAMAMGALEGSVECEWMAIFCAMFAVPVAAASGAVITAADTLPEEQAHQLNRITHRAAMAIHLSDKFKDAMWQEAHEQGLDLRTGPADVAVRITATEFWWEVSPGNNVALHLKVEATALRNGEERRRRLSYRGDAVPADDWLANKGERIETTLETFMDEASEDIWPRLLDRD